MTAQHRIVAGVGELTLTVASASHVGKVREVNEDASLAVPPVFAVADGMGGHAFGDRASAAAVQALRGEFDAEEPIGSERVLAAIQHANTAVRRLTSGGWDRVIAGTTLTGVALVVEHPEAVPIWMVFNLGDSRVYRWDADAAVPRLDRVSVDHSIVQELLDAGIIDEQRARSHPDRNIITRALGAADQVETEAWLLSADEPQTFLICSDGLTKELDDIRIAALLAESQDDPDRGVALLLDAALEAGGHDNITLVVVRADYRAVGADDGTDDGPDEQTRDRALSPELENTRPRR